MKSFVFTISIVLAVVAASIELGYHLLVSPISKYEQDICGLGMQSPQTEQREVIEEGIPSSFIAFVQQVYVVPAQEKATMIEEVIVKGAENLSRFEQDVHLQLFRMDQQMRSQIGVYEVVFGKSNMLIPAWRSLEEIELDRAYAQSDEAALLKMQLTKKCAQQLVAPNVDR